MTQASSILRKDINMSAQAITNYAKEESLTKDIHYIRIFTQLNAAQQKRKSLGQDDQMSKVSLTLTRRQMKQSFEANTVSP